MSIFWKTQPRNVFSGKNKAKKYLKAINSESNQHTDLLRLYVSGELEVELQKYSFDLIEVFVDKLRKDNIDLQVNLRVKNKNIGLDLFRDYYELCFYLSGCDPEEVENSIIRYEYIDFDLDVLLKKIESKLR
ncbi:hypothetical protein BK010_03310 [Tenericutes bacterium MO-XQ]|nr:hypothetical protein BK010_03310 [Tenericutes bacterium MO-XQ]